MNNYLLNKRTIFNLNNDSVNIKKFLLGFLLYFIIFMLIIPYYLIKFSKFKILTGYLPNLDLIAAVIGYNGGPFNLFLWKQLYNPSSSTMIGYISSNLINYFSLLGITYIIALNVYKFNDIEKGWSRALIMLPMSYLLPTNFIIYYMNLFGNLINSLFHDLNHLHYFITVIFGFLLVTFIIILESEIIYIFGNMLSKIIKKLKFYILN